MAAVDQSQFNKSRLDKFLLVIDLPNPLKDILTTDLADRKNTSIISDSLQFSVYGSIVPEVLVPEKALGYAGQSIKISSHVRPVYPNVNVNFTIDNQFNNYWTIYKWLDFLNDEKESVFNSKNIAKTPEVASGFKTKKTLTPSDLYQADFSLYAKNEFDQDIVKFTYTNAFPVSLGKIDFNYRDPGEIETSFEFAFSQLLVELI